MADLLSLVCDVYCDFVTFPFGILRQVWYLIVSIPDPCCLSYLYTVHTWRLKTLKYVTMFVGIQNTGLTQTATSFRFSAFSLFKL